MLAPGLVWADSPPVEPSVETAPASEATPSLEATPAATPTQPSPVSAATTPPTPRARKLEIVFFGLVLLTVGLGIRVVVTILKTSPS